MLVRRLIIFCLFYSGINLAYSQSHVDAPFYIDEYTKLGKRMDVYSFLDEAIPQIQMGCTPTSDFFFFRVRATGKIDSLYHSGNLPKEITSKIISNIYATEGHWKTKRKVNKEEFCWFIFPYFFYGDDPYHKNNCTEAEMKQQESVMIVVGNIVKLSSLLKNKKVVLLSPSENGGGIIKK